MAASADGQGTFVQDRFAIGFWVDPPADDLMEARYAEIAQANFTLVIGGFGARTPETVQRQLDLCEKHDLKALVSRAGLQPDRLPESPACWGYMLRDEPNVAHFAALRQLADEIWAARPGKLCYINLFPNYANAAQLGAPTYDEHVARFVQDVGVRVLSMDHYPRLQRGSDARKAYCDNLAVMRKYSLQEGIPFWNFFYCMPFGGHEDPSESVIRWQVFTSLAYGAKGVLYFCYYTPGGGEFPRGGAVITRDGRRTRHYDQAQRLNARLKQMGPTLMQLTSTGVRKLGPKDDARETLAGSGISSLQPSANGEYLIGTFSHADGRRAVMLCNYDHLYTSWPTVEFDVDPAQAVEVDQQTGEEGPVLDDSPDMEGLQLSLDCGEGRLFLLPGD